MVQELSPYTINEHGQLEYNGHVVIGVYENFFHAVMAAYFVECYDPPQEEV